MKSKANIGGHPMHPALIPFPFAFLIGAFLFNLLGFLFNQEDLWTTGGHLVIAGIIAALIAAAPGVIDYVHTVPPQSSAKERATKHALVNLSAVVIFAVAFMIRGAATAPPSVLILGLELLGVGLLSVGGWMGGTLVYRNQLGVDPRYAQAGKWNEKHVEAKPGQAVVVARADELAVNQMKLLRVNGRRIVLGRTEEGYVAFDDRCTHKGGSLAGGTMICGTVQCPWHGSQFEVRSGAVKAGPASDAIGTYHVEQSGEEVRLRLQG